MRFVKLQRETCNKDSKIKGGCSRICSGTSKVTLRLHFRLTASLDVMLLSKASLKFHCSSLPWHCPKHGLNGLGRFEHASFSRLILVTLKTLGWQIIIKLPNYICIILYTLIVDIKGHHHICIRIDIYIYLNHIPLYLCMFLYTYTNLIGQP